MNNDAVGREKEKEKERKKSAKEKTKEKEQRKQNVDGKKNLMQTLTDELIKGVHKCCICHDSIEQTHEVWECGKCFLVLHLGCAKKWAIQCVGVNMNPIASSQWRCPVCSSNYFGEPQYLCFCGKEKSPPSSAFFTPHSCGEVCGKALGPKGSCCQHNCNLLCHPGPCDPCAAVLLAEACYCGKSVLQRRCGEMAISCGSLCGRQLNCCMETHRCVKECHAGNCDPCGEVINQSCFCGREETQKYCGSGILCADGLWHYSCNFVCDKYLSCGNHRCEQICHDGSCRICPRSCNRDKNGYSKCACGAVTMKLSVPRKSCMDPLPTCFNPCNKMLTCGTHYCTRLCHDSDCLSCDIVSLIPCRCGREKKNVRCGDQRIFLCDRRCLKKLSCGIHKCQEMCCTLEEHFCQLICGKKLACGHTCPNFCHVGPCPQSCGIMHWNGITCRCGRSRINGSVPCGTPLPICKMPCSVVRSCQHPCVYPCHEDDCPPCVVLVERTCETHGTLIKHRPCRMQNATCGAICGKLMECKLHFCTRNCHIGDCVLHNKSGISLPVKSCGSICDKPKPCGHPCLHVCHPQQECPDFDCLARVTIFCPCKVLSQSVLCNEVDTHSLQCGDICQAELRKKNIREAFEINPERKKNLIYVPYAVILIQLAQEHIKFIASMESQLQRLITPNPSESIIPSFYLSDISKPRLYLLQQMSLFYFVEVEELPGKTIRVLKTNMSMIPQTLLSFAARLFDKHAASKIATAEAWPSNCCLVFYNFVETMKFYMVQTYLAKWWGQYTLSRVELNSEQFSPLAALSPAILSTAQAVAVFNSSQAAREVAQSLDPKGHFVCSLVSDLLQPLSSLVAEEKSAAHEIISKLPEPKERVRDAWDDDELPTTAIVGSTSNIQSLPIAENEDFQLQQIVNKTMPTISSVVRVKGFDDAPILRKNRFDILHL